MKYLWKFSGVYLAFLIQSLFLENIKIFSCSPDILTAVVVICAVSSGFKSASFLGAFAGLLIDVMYGKVFGINVLVYMYLALLVSMAVDEKNSNSPLIMGWVCFVSIAAMEIVLSVLKALLGRAVSVGNICADIFVKGFFAGLFALILVLLVQYIKKRGKATCISSEKEAVE